MIVFKTFWKILNKNKLTVIIYTTILLVFAISNLSTSEKNMSFQAEKPDIYIMNNDEETILIKEFFDYMSKNCNLKKIEKNEENIKDALFYREINYIISIPSNYTEDFLNGKNPEIQVQSTGDYQSAYAEMIFTRFIQVANIYQNNSLSQEELVNKIEDTLKNEVDVKMTSELNITETQKATVYYNFASYSLIACLVFMISLILNSFNNSKTKKRIIISSENYKKHNFLLLLSNCCYALIMWGIYVAVSLILLRNTMFSLRGLIYILNSFVFTICVTTLSFLIANIVSNKEALSGISNVISLGSSFLCGVFVPLRWLPNLVVKIAHIIPTYYYINSNDLLETMEEINLITLKPIIKNSIIILGFSIFFIILSNFFVRRKRRFV